MRNRLGCILAVVCATIMMPSLATSSEAAHAIVAKANGNALVLWDASAEVTLLLSQKLPNDQIKARLTQEALRILATSTSSISNSATTVTIRILYDKTGSVSPVYGSSTFAGVEHYADLRMSGHDFFSDRDHWRRVTNNRMIPSFLHFDVVGELPAR